MQLNCVVPVERFKRGKKIIFVKLIVRLLWRLYRYRRNHFDNDFVQLIGVSELENCFISVRTTFVPILKRSRPFRQFKYIIRINRGSWRIGTLGLWNRSSSTIRYFFSSLVGFFASRKFLPDIRFIQQGSIVDLDIRVCNSKPNMQNSFSLQGLIQAELKR